MMKLLKSMWTRNVDSNAIGFALVESEPVKERKIYIGTGLGIDEHSDIQRIMYKGGKIYPHMVEEMLVHLLGHNPIVKYHDYETDKPTKEGYYLIYWNHWEDYVEEDGSDRKEHVRASTHGYWGLGNDGFRDNGSPIIDPDQWCVIPMPKPAPKPGETNNGQT